MILKVLTRRIEARQNSGKQHTASSSSAQLRPFVRRGLIAQSILLPSLILMESAQLGVYPIVFWTTTLLAPLVFGVWLGWAVTGKQRRLYVLAATVTALFALLGINAVIGNLPPSQPTWLANALFTAIVGFMFVAGGLIGDAFETHSPRNLWKRWHGFAVGTLHVLSLLAGELGLENTMHSQGGWPLS